MSDEVFMYLHMTLFMIGNLYLIYSKSIRRDSIAEALDEKDELEAEYESEVAKHKAWEKRIEELKQNIEKENAEMDHLVFLSSLALASMVGGATMANLLAKNSNQSRHDMDEFIKLQKERELHRCMLDVMDMPKQQDRMKKEEESAMSLYPLPKTEELTLKEKLKQHDTYNGYYPNIKKVDLTQPIKFKKISLVINRYLTIPISEVAKDSLIGGDQYYLECLLAIYRIDKNNKYNIPSYIDVNSLRFFYEESRILCVDSDDLNTRVVKVKVQGSTISLPSASTRRDIMESISLLYPYVDLTKAYYDSDAHLYDFDSKNLIIESKKKLSDEELNSAFKHIVSSSKFVDNIKADVINANAFVPHEYPLRFPKGEEEKQFEWPKEVVAREWFFGIEETEEETKARYKIQEKNMVGWDDF